jgi:hypothetical protein
VISPTVWRSSFRGIRPHTVIHLAPSTIGPWIEFDGGGTLELPEDILVQLRIEKFCDRVSKTLYQNPLDPLGVLLETEQASMMSVLREEYRDLEESLGDRLTG